MIRKEIYQVNENFYGYIVDNGIFRIQQSHLPAVGGIVGMTKRTAEMLADYIAEKLEKDPNNLPTVTVEELIDLGVFERE
jgi:hypothetical protein